MEIKTTQRYHFFFLPHIGKNSKCLITHIVGKPAGKQPKLLGGLQNGTVSVEGNWAVSLVINTCTL